MGVGGGGSLQEGQRAVWGAPEGSEEGLPARVVDGELCGAVVCVGCAGGRVGGLSCGAADRCGAARGPGRRLAECAVAE